jgi:hypothetical protein
LLAVLVSAMAVLRLQVTPVVVAVEQVVQAAMRAMFRLLRVVPVFLLTSQAQVFFAVAAVVGVRLAVLTALGVAVVAVPVVPQEP